MCVCQKFLLSVRIGVRLFPVSFYLGFALIVNLEKIFTIEIEISLDLPCIKSNKTIVSLERGFHLSPHVASGNVDVSLNVDFIRRKILSPQK